MASIRPGAGHSVLQDELYAIRQQLVRSELTEGSQRKYGETLDRLERFLERGLGLRSLVDVEHRDIERFIAAPTIPGAAISIGTMHVRRAVVRFAFRTARNQGLLNHDPTLDLNLPARRGRRSRPLSDSEVERCRAASLRSLQETRLPAAWALAEATATPSEIAAVTAGGVDLVRLRVRLDASGRCAARWGSLTAWGVEQLERRVDSLPEPRFPLVFRGQGGENSAQASASRAIRWTFVLAGLVDDPLVKPSSVRAWRAQLWFKEGIPIQEIACRLGMRSLDRVAALAAGVEP